MTHPLKLAIAFAVAGTVAAAGAAEPRHPAKKKPRPAASASAAQPKEKLIRAPGGVLIPPRRPDRTPGFMDDGASKHRS